VTETHRWAVPVQIGARSKTVGYAVVEASGYVDAELAVKAMRARGEPVVPALWLPPPEDALKMGIFKIEDEGDQA
jgi:hypothetical protein